ncbi:hypothetical protein K469DRAFT_587270 [Zopfia rhizophila CBS 207.26]|uniref:Uncharacterized protein n=1 Tax=Zopfia rhizophila CBS 207.26 TaxID=1314779 RepID=A0A6A6DU52_9PEZI|nr:hypothetical protein K469DRAFT_587270 [Zopfia rhizophila CBS 207.26]
MLPPPPQDVVHGWMSTPNIRGTRDILSSSLSTIWLCTWTCLYLNIPPLRSRRGHRALLYKFCWQLFAIFFPEVLVATAAEQWLSARQSVTAFSRLGHSEWTIRHGFFADMGGILIAPLDCEPFPVDSQQLAYLVQNKHMDMPDITVDGITSVDKANGLARFVTLLQMGWFCVSCIARGAGGLGFSTLEVTTLAFILCTLHTFFFWYYKPLDPEIQKALSVNAEIKHLCQRPGIDPDLPESYTITPLDFVKPPPDPKSLITPFWFGLAVVSGQDRTATHANRPAQTLPNSRVLPQDGVSMALTIYMVAFQLLYYGLHIGFGWIAAFPSSIEWYLWTVSNCADFGLILLYILAIPLGTHFAPFLGRLLFDMEATGIIQVASALPQWAKLVIHGPFIVVYIMGRVVVLVESLVSLRALPRVVYEDISWSNSLPHL